MATVWLEEDALEFLEQNTIRRGVDRGEEHAQRPDDPHGDIEREGGHIDDGRRPFRQKQLANGQGKRSRTAKAKASPWPMSTRKSVTR